MILLFFVHKGGFGVLFLYMFEKILLFCDFFIEFVCSFK